MATLSTPPTSPRPSTFEALAHVTDGLASEDFNVARAAYARLLDLGKLGIYSSIVGYMHDARFEVRAYVAMACGELGATPTGPALLASVGDPSWPVRARVAEALGRLSPAGATDALVVLLQDPDEPVADAAAEALVHAERVRRTVARLTPTAVETEAPAGPRSRAPSALRVSVHYAV